MKELDEAVAALRAGEVVVIPTDTVYGLAALPSVPGAVERIFEVKRRRPEKPLPVLGSSLEQLGEVAVFDDAARVVASAFWPGAVTLVLRRAKGFTYDLGAGAEDTVAVRVPDHHLALRLLERCGPLAATSANISGEPAATTVDEARAALGAAVRVYLDGGIPAGTASTVVSLVDGLTVFREGTITEDDITRVLSG